MIEFKLAEENGLVCWLGCLFHTMNNSQLIFRIQDSLSKIFWKQYMESKLEEERSVPWLFNGCCLFFFFFLTVWGLFWLKKLAELVVSGN